MTWIDIILIPIYLPIIVYFLKQYRDRHYIGTPVYDLFMKAWWAKFAGIIGFLAVYQFYYNYNGDYSILGAGDSGMYYIHGTQFNGLYFSNPQLAVDFLFTEAPTWNAESASFLSGIEGWSNKEQFAMYKIIGLLGFVSFNDYFILDLFFSLFAFTGLIKLLEVFRRRYPQYTQYLMYSILFIPSLLFWSGGLLKDTLCLGALCRVVYYTDSIFFRGKNIIFSVVKMGLMIKLLLLLKGYIIICFLPAGLIWVYLSYVQMVKNIVIRVFISIVLATSILGAGYFMLSFLASATERYALENLATTMQGFHSYHGHLADIGTTASGGGSGYKLTVTSYSASGMARIFPAAVNVALFRPYLWEARSPVMLASALESLAIFICFLYLVRKAGLRKFISFSRNPEIAMCIIFTILLAFACGATAFNFGALVRFKIQLMPFFLTSLMLLWCTAVRVTPTTEVVQQ